MAIIPLHRLARHVPVRRLAWTSIRTASTIVGKSGRVYVEGKLLRHRSEGRNTFKAEYNPVPTFPPTMAFWNGQSPNCRNDPLRSGNESFVLRHAPEPFYRLSTFLPGVFASTRRLRVVVDSSDEDNVLIYPYFRGTLLELIQTSQDLSAANRKKILRHLAEAIHELHTKDLIHLDLEPQNVLVNWTCNEDGTKTITDIALGDFWEMQRGGPHGPHQSSSPVGQMAWRSPEAHVGRAMTEASDMYSFGLLCAYALGGGDKLLLGNYFNEETMLSGGIGESELVTGLMGSRFAYFGPPTKGFFEAINDEEWSAAFMRSSRLADQMVEALPEYRFEVWGAGFGPVARDMILGLTKSDPAARLTIDQVLAHPWWREEDHDTTLSSPSRPTDPKMNINNSEAAAANTTTTRAPLRLLHPEPFPNLAAAEALRQALLTNPAVAFPAPQPTKAHLVRAASSNFGEWVNLNFPRTAGYLYYDLGHLQADITFTFLPDAEATGLPAQGTIPAAETRLLAIARVGGDQHARDEDGKKRGGVVCVALFAVPPDRGGAGGPERADWTATTHGTPEMEAAEKALEGACRAFAEKGYGEHGAAGREAVEGCMGVVVMGVGMSISEYSDEKGFYDPPGGLVEEMVAVKWDDLGMPRPQEKVVMSERRGI